MFGNCTYPDHAYFILPLGKHDFKKLNLGKYDFPSIVEILHGVVMGLATLHDWSILHRDVTVANMLVMSDDPPVGALCDFGKAVQQDWHTDGGAPGYAQAPEIDGTKRYDAKADVWSCGLAFASVFFPDMSKWPSFNANSKQSRAWIKVVCEHLQKFGSQSTLHGMVAIIVAKMLNFDPKSRPPMCVVLDKWPLQVSPKFPHVSLNVAGRSAKISRTPATSQSYKNPTYQRDWFEIEPATRQKRALGYKPLTKSTAAILPSTTVVRANLEAAEMMRLGQGFTPEHPERRSQMRFNYTVRKIDAMTENRWEDEEASTEILGDDESPASAGGPDWDKVPDWEAPIDGTGRDLSRGTPAGSCDNGGFF